MHELLLLNTNNKLIMIFLSFLFVGTITISVSYLFSFINFIVIIITIVLGTALTYWIIKPKITINIDQIIADLSKHT